MNKIVPLAIIILFFYSCQKIVSDFDPQVSADCKLTRLVQGTGAHDTVYLFSYNNKGQLIALTDSTNNNIFHISYDANGNLIKFSDGVYYNFEAAYNADGLPVKTTSAILSGGNIALGSQLVYEYNAAKQPVKSVESTYDNGVWKRAEVRQYEFAGGDISRINFYFIGPGSDSTKIYTTEYQYYPESNSFHSLSFLGPTYAILGFFDLIDIDFYFNKHLYKTSGTSASGTFQYDYFHNYERDSTTRLITADIGFRSNAIPPASVYTRHFWYSCK